MSVPTIKVYLLTVVLPEVTKKLWDKDLGKNHTYYIARAGTQWRGLNLQALKCFPIQGYEIFKINTIVNLDEPIVVSEDILKGYLDGKDTLAAVIEKLENYLSTLTKNSNSNTVKKKEQLNKKQDDQIQEDMPLIETLESVSTISKKSTKSMRTATNNKNEYNVDNS